MLPEDADGGELAPDGRVMEMLSEHTLLGWLEGYLLTGRHGFFHTYEAFAHVDRLDVQPAREVAGHLARTTCPGARRWRRRTSCCRRPSGGRITTASRTRIPGFIDLVTNKSPSVTRVYLPPDANTLLVGRRSLPAQHRLHQRHRRRQAEAPAVHDDRRGDRPLREGHRHLGARQHRCGRGARRRAGVLRRRRDDGGAGGRGDPARARAGSEAALRQRRRSVQAAAGVRASARVDGAGVRQPVHDRQADHLQLPRLSVADSQAGVPLQGPRQPARPRLQGKGQHQHAARAGDAERDVALPSGHRRHRSRAEAAGAAART